ncbi:MAG: alpha/beta hydrolase, partial [Coleofasciculus sp. C2-GNP5-27]
MNYGVVDLVELIRQIDQAVIERRQSEDIRIKLNFLGHSMGCFVVTNVVRILSDVFDTESINKQPSNYIGRGFSLGRLILVAPDISIDSIMPVRSNFLRSALRRCEEAYLFSNEGDLALRLASTAVNYISFPAKTRFRGYRLGNLTVQRFADQYDYRNQRLTEKDYGIVNNKNGQIESPYC